MSWDGLAEIAARSFKRETWRRTSDEERFQIMVEGWHREESLAVLSRQEGTRQNLDHEWSK